eukprot:NODE_10_length_47437_cov_0.363429.p14 type:complete len:295 gc:universal NODE_10_length_47437_cov_0.363429:19904-20788(+)
MLFTIVAAHFTLIGSREQAKWPASNERFWPINGGATLRSVDDCLKLPASKPTVVPSGPYTIHWEIGNGAHHVGMCEAYLIDTKSGASEKIGEEDNCVSTKQALTVDLSKHSCTSCVIKATVAADHLVTSIENYDSCMDVTFDGSASSDSESQTTSPAASETVTESTAPSQAPDTASASSAPPTTPDANSVSGTPEIGAIPTQPALTAPEIGAIPTQPALTAPEIGAMPTQPALTAPEIGAMPTQPALTAPELSNLPGFTAPSNAENLTIRKQRKRRHRLSRNVGTAAPAVGVPY